MSDELDGIMRYGIPTIKKFEWANCYRVARPGAMTERNILSGAGLFPFNPRKALRRHRSRPEAALTSEVKLNPGSEVQTLGTIAATPPSRHFGRVPATPSQLDPIVLRSANEALHSKIQESILDMPIREYIPKLVGLSEHLHATNIIVERNHESLNAIVQKRREMAQGKHVVLKDQTLVTTEEVYQNLRVAEEVTHKPKCSTSQRKNKRVSITSQVSRRDAKDGQCFPKQ